MPDVLTAKSAFAGLLPIRHGGLAALEVVPGAVVSVAPFRGKYGDVSAALTPHGLTFPAPGQAIEGAVGAAIWTGIDECFILSDAPLTLELAGLAATTDQTDGWGWLRLTGEDWPGVMARLCPVDTAEMRSGQAIRSEVAHMMAVIYGVSDGVVIGVMRSFAETLAHDISVAMTSVAAQKDME